MTNEIIERKIENMIYEVRGKQVMLDSDLALLYGCKNGTKEINQAVKNNPVKFPDRFAFRISEEEYYSLKSKILTSKGGSRKGHTVFTEQGIAMLSTILKSKIATEVSIAIMDAFVAMRHYCLNISLEQKYLNNMILKHDNQIKILEETFASFQPQLNHVFYEGQIYDAYSLMLDIFESSKESIIIIDNYTSKELLDLLSKTKRKIKVYSKNMNEELIKKYQRQYDNVEIVESSSFHDRFIIIDKKLLYHCGASFKELGKKCFGINRVEDNKILKNIIEELGEKYD